MGLIAIDDTSRELEPRFYEHLETGDILFFSQSPIQLGEDDYQFLRSQHQTEARYHKNIAYRAAEDKLTGVARGADREKLRGILSNFTRQAAEVLGRLLPRYGHGARLDFTSFRPFEEEGRPLPLHSRNDLLHVDAFPTRPTYGDRILRFFTNINHEQGRVWLTSEPFSELAGRFAHEAGLVELARRRHSPFWEALAWFARAAGWRQFSASPYDVVMHRFHNFMKENSSFQQQASKSRFEFPPQSSWLVFTDMVSHAVLAGRLALEQTFIVPYQRMLNPDRSPIKILERLAGFPLTWRE